MGFDLKRILSSGRPGRHGARGGLSVLLRADGRAYWEYQFRDRQTKRTRTSAIGYATGAEALTLSAARIERNRIYAANRAGTLSSAMPTRAAAAATGKTFAEVLIQYLDKEAGAWKGGAEGDEAKKFRQLLKLDHAKRPIAALTAPDVKTMLAPWHG